MKIAFTTLGCKVNQYETQALREMFALRGFTVVPEDAPADVCVVNTCSVTNLSDRKSRQALRRFRRDNPGALVVAVGCYAQTGTEALSEMKEVDLIAGTNQKSLLPQLVERSLAERGKIRSEKKDTHGDKSKAGSRPLVQVMERQALVDFEDLGRIEAMEGRTRAYVKIQEGCDRFCSYCIIPYARGPVRSRSQEEILKEVRLLAERGYPEIVLTGINTALYGGEEAVKRGERIHSHLRDLMGKIEELPGDFRIRLGSLEPTVIDRDYVKELLVYERLCHHLHLSVQSGSDRILRAMNRRYSIGEYRGIVELLKNFDPHFGITTDIIVGFPGESDEDFEQSLQLAREVDFSRIHVFRYSRRKGTAADRMREQIPSPEKQRRSALLSQASGESAHRFLMGNSGQIRKVILEEKDQKLGMFSGLTDNYIKVYVKEEALREEEALHRPKNVKLQEPFLDGMAGILI